MKKNLFEALVIDEVIERSQRLSEDSPARWGTMNAAEMLHHCTNAIKATIYHQNPGKPSTAKQKLSRFLILNIMPTFPKGAKTPKKLDVKLNNVSGLTLQNEQQDFAKSLHEFADFKGDITTSHPYFGKLNRKQWGIFTWMHMDHHLRQFGV